MFRKLFTRIFVNTMLVLFAALFALGSIFANFIWRTEYNNGKEKMVNEAQSLAQAFGYMAKQWINSRVLTDMITQYSEDSTIWMVSMNGLSLNLVGMADQVGPETLPDTVSDYISMVSETGNTLILEGVFDRDFGIPIVTVVTPLYGNRDQMVGVMFMHRRLTLVRADVSALYSGMNPAIIVAVLVGLILSYTVSLRITRPLREMSQAAKRLAAGDMSTRVHVSNTEEINELAIAFNSMVEDLSRMEDVRRGFVANVSHELRSPITSISGYLQGMLDGTIPESEHPKYMQVVLDETGRLSRLIRDLLDLSRIESGSFPLNIIDFELNEMIRRVLIKFDGRLEEQNMQVEIDFCEDPLRVNADLDRIEQVVSNLVDNALKYCGQYGTLTISTKKQDNRVVVWIMDDGAGIAAEDLPHIFDRFYKADKAHTVGLGTGLGLSIVKKIIEQHGQTIGVESTQGEGAKFYFTIALSK